MTRFLISFAVFLVTVAIPAGAQVAEGSKVRFTTTSNQNFVGVVRSQNPDSLTINVQPSGVPTTIALSAISKLEISRGKSAMQGAKKGLRRGGILGVALVGALYLASGGRGEEDVLGETVVIAAAGGALFGGAIGALVGSEKWEGASVGPLAASSTAGSHESASRPFRSRMHTLPRE